MSLTATKDEKLAHLTAELELEKARGRLWHQAAQSNHDVLQKLQDVWAELKEYVSTRVDFQKEQVEQHDLPLNCARLETLLNIQNEMTRLTNKE